MIEEGARVVGVDGGDALVAVTGAGSCNACAMRRACGTSRMAEPGGERTQVFRVANSIAATQGDRVALAIADSALPKAALLAYLVPLFGLLAGAVLASAAELGEVAVAVGAAAGSAIGVVAARWLSGRCAAQFALRIEGRTA
jgi:sigma-E factor negative regulatory protein RseC